MKPELDVLNPVSTSMAPYTGVWSVQEAAHLLRRTLFGAQFQQITQAVSDGLDTTVSKLMLSPKFTEPLSYASTELVTSPGDSWVRSVYPATPIESFQCEESRRKSLDAWLMQRVNQTDLSVHEKMSLFWQNHFAAEGCSDARATYDYFNLLRTQAIGNFKTLIQEMTINPNMLVFLNGDKNTKYSPNENYARELLELFTIGKGAQVGASDYTNYTELDVSAGSRILTGWDTEGMRSTTLSEVVAVFTASEHDVSSKTLSNRFGNQVIGDAQNTEYLNYIDVIFAQNETANFICRKLYRWFVSSTINATIETDVIAEMAEILRTNNYEIQPVLIALFKSEHFYDVNHRGAIIKNPIEFLFSIYNSTASEPNFDLESNYLLYQTLKDYTSSMGMNYRQPPNVGGWVAYYQKPVYYKNWVNSSYMKLRLALASNLTVYGGVQVNGVKFELNFLTFLDNLSQPSNSVQVIEDVLTVFLPKEISQTQKSMLETVLLDSLPAFEWTVEYDAYRSDPTNEALSNAIQTRVAKLLEQVFKLLEFQTN